MCDGGSFDGGSFSDSSSSGHSGGHSFTDAAQAAVILSTVSSPATPSHEGPAPASGAPTPPASHAAPAASTPARIRPLELSDGDKLDFDTALAAARKHGDLALGPGDTNLQPSTGVQGYGAPEPAGSRERLAGNIGVALSVAAGLALIGVAVGVIATFASTADDAVLTATYVLFGALAAAFAFGAPAAWFITVAQSAETARYETWRGATGGGAQFKTFVRPIEDADLLLELVGWYPLRHDAKVFTAERHVIAQMTLPQTSLTETDTEHEIVEDWRVIAQQLTDTAYRQWGESCGEARAGEELRAEAAAAAERLSPRS
jgi:hypothetical protein